MMTSPTDSNPGALGSAATRQGSPNIPLRTSGRSGRGWWTRGVAALTGLAFTLVTTQIVGDIFLPNVARAAPPQPNKRVALYVVGKNKAAAGDAKVIEAFLRTELSSLVNVSAVVSGTEPPATLRELVLPSVEAGFRALNERNGEAAEKAFSKAYRDLVQYRGDFDKRIFARILKGYGSAQVLDGNVGAGQETIDTGLNLWPNQMIQEYGWTLDLRTAFNELSNRKSQLKPGSIEVDTDPPGAAVRVNGVLRGFAPVTIQDLAAGRHWIETTIDGYGRESMFVEVPSGDSAIHSLELLPTPAKSQFDTAMAALVRGLPKGQVGPSLSDLQRVMKADAVIALELSSTNTNYVLAGFIRDGQGEPQRVTRTVAKDGDLPSNLRSFLATILKREVGADDSDLALDGPPQTSVMGEGDIVLDPRDPIFRTRDTKTDDSVTSEWWFWTLIGGVTAGLVVGGIALFSGEDQGSGPAGNLVINVNRLP